MPNVFYNLAFEKPNADAQVCKIEKLKGFVKLIVQLIELYKSQDPIYIYIYCNKLNSNFLILLF